jgi:hypothetical protein
MFSIFGDTKIKKEAVELWNNFKGRNIDELF